MRVCLDKIQLNGKNSAAVKYINKLKYMEKVSKCILILEETFPIRWSKPVSSKE